MFSGWYFGTCRFRFIGMAAAILLTAPMPATATEHHWTWTIANVDGMARTGEGNGVWWSMQLGAEVQPGSHIETGPDGRITLVHGGDSIEVAPNTEFSVSNQSGPAEGVEHEDSDIIQTFGALLFRMESRESRDFTVDTPFLAAAIKGTAFTVSVSGNKSVVVVEEGTVEVTAVATGEITLVEAGGSVSASRGAGIDVLSGPDPVDDKPENHRGDRSDRDGASGGGGARSSGDDD